MSIFFGVLSLISYLIGMFVFSKLYAAFGEGYPRIRELIFWPYYVFKGKRDSP